MNPQRKGFSDKMMVPQRTMAYATMNKPNITVMPKNTINDVNRIPYSNKPYITKIVQQKMDEIRGCSPDC